jgi:aminoglycoside phosphotransferase (APT) family kinase protein
MTLTQEDILHRLRLAGIAVNETRLWVESRKGRILVHLDDDRVAWFPEHPEGRVAAENERRILRLVETYCRFRAPRILYENAEGWDVRAIVPGVAATDFLTQVRTDPRAAERTGAALGRILAEQHTRIPASDLDGWLARIPQWPRSAAIANLPKVIEDFRLLARIRCALEHWGEIGLHVSDAVLVHCDLGSWNLAVSPATGDVQGVFDYGDAVLGDRHQDFKYMQFHRPEEQVMLDAAIKSYEDTARIILDRERIRFFNAIEAIGFLGFRFGHTSDERWCGRTLREDVEWTTTALEAAGF